jgi:hypothetical protein
VLAALSRRRSRVQIPSGPLGPGPPRSPGQVAQSVERAAENRKVGGSIPSLPTTQAAASSLSKGSRVVVVGRLQQRTWTAEDGSARSVVEVVAEELGPHPMCLPLARPARDDAILPFKALASDTGGLLQRL